MTEKKFFTKAEISAQLEELGVPKDNVVLMHTSLRKVGETEGRGNGLLDTLIAHCTAEGGLFCVPTHTWMNLDPGMITMDMTEAKTCIGTLPDIAAGRPDAHRSLHPTHSMAVFGEAEKAEAFIADEINTRSPGDLNGCYGKIYDMGGSILLVGVGLERNTYMHSAEERLDVPNRLTEKMNDQMTIRLKNGEILHVSGYNHCAGDPSQYFGKMEPAFRHYGVIRDGFIGNAKAMLVDARKCYEVMKLVREKSGGIELFADHEPLKEEYYK